MMSFTVIGSAALASLLVSVAALDNGVARLPGKLNFLHYFFPIIDLSFLVLGYNSAISPRLP
jgi:hypothetical protein